MAASHLSSTTSVLISGSVSVPLGGGYKIVLLPLVWALLIGAVWGACSAHLPRTIELDIESQRLAAAILQPALLLFVGGPLLLSSGAGLVLGFVLSLTIVIRSFGEEAMLKAELPGYREYMERVRSRMIPFVF